MINDHIIFTNTLYLENIRIDLDTMDPITSI